MVLPVPAPRTSHGKGRARCQTLAAFPSPGKAATQGSVFATRFLQPCTLDKPLPGVCPGQQNPNFTKKKPFIFFLSRPRADFCTNELWLPTPLSQAAAPEGACWHHFRFNRGSSQVWEGDKMITRIFSASARPPPALTEPLVQMGEPARAAALVLPLWVGASPTLGQPRLVLRVIKQRFI